MFGSYSETKSPILILHGMFGSSNNWRSLGKKIASEMGTAVRIITEINSCALWYRFTIFFLEPQGPVHYCKPHLPFLKAVVGYWSNVSHTHS